MSKESWGQPAHHELMDTPGNVASELVSLGDKLPADLLLDSVALADLQKRLCVWATEQSEMDALYLHGSVAGGRGNHLSDVDVAILAQRELPRKHLWRPEDYWAGQWPAWLDLRVLNLAPLSFQFAVITRGQRLWTRKIDQIADYESWVRRSYWDLLPFLEEDWNQFTARLWEKRNETERRDDQAAFAQIRAVHRRIRETPDRAT